MSSTLEPEPCAICHGAGYLIGQTYGYCEVPDGWSPVQRCDACEAFEDDEDAARAYAARMGSASVEWSPGPPADYDHDWDAPGDWIVHDLEVNA